MKYADIIHINFLSEIYLLHTHTHSKKTYILIICCFIFIGYGLFYNLQFQA